MEPKKSLFYDGLNINTEKSAVILDLGYSYTKCGFAGEHAPRFIIPTVVENVKTREVRKVLEYKTDEELTRNLVDFMQVVYFRHLLVTPKERRVVVVESLLTPSRLRNTLASVLFSQFEVPSVLFAPSHLVAAMSLGLPSALVMDLGTREALILPVCEGTPLLHCWQALPLGANAVHSQVRGLLQDHASVKMGTKEDRPLKDAQDAALLITDAVLEDIKVRCCFVTRQDRASARLQGQSVEYPPGLEYPLGGQAVLTIPGIVREEACEVLFQTDGDATNLTALLLDSILKAPVDFRRELAENVVVMGGGAHLKGLTARIQREAEKMLSSGRYSEGMGVTGLKFHSPPARPNCCAWLGGALFGALEILGSRSLTAEAFEKNKKRVPDWTVASQEVTSQAGSSGGVGRSSPFRGLTPRRDAKSSGAAVKGTGAAVKSTGATS